MILSALLPISGSLFFGYYVYKGYFWMVITNGSVMINDIMAFVFGKTMGKTPLIKLSPNKTVEGFVGGGLSTCVFAIWVSQLIFLIFLFSIDCWIHISIPLDNMSTTNFISRSFRKAIMRNPIDLFGTRVRCFLHQIQSSSSINSCRSNFFVCRSDCSIRWILCIRT